MRSLLLFLVLLCRINSYSQKENIISDNLIKVRNAESFHSIVIKGPFKVHFSSGNDFQIAVSASNESARDRIITNVSGNQLDIHVEGTDWKSLRNNSDYTVYLSSPMINKIVASGAVDFDVHDQIKTNELKLVFSGASDFSGDVLVDKLDAVFSGGSDLKAKGKVDQLKLTMSGASDCKCFELVAENAEMVASGASDIKITVNKTIKATASGASDIEYKGSPSKIETRSWAGSITKKGS